MKNDQKTMIEEALSILKVEKEVTEIRILKSPKGTISGFFNDQEQLAAAALKYDGKAPGIYITLNPVKPGLLARAENRVIERAKTTTSDADIESRRWFQVDFDPVRPSGISSTDEEHEAALEMARNVRKFLKEKGWSDPIFADSGNGAHLLYAIHLPNDDASRILVKTALEALHLHFTTEIVDVDTTTFNAARIWKLYGTMACKGDHLEVRPHRLSQILDYPVTREEVSAEKLEALAETCPTLPSDVNSTSKNSSTEKGFDLEAFILEHELNVALTGPWQQGSTKYVLGKCPWNESHTDKSAVIIRFANGGIAAKCHHNSCSEENWQTLRKKLDPNWNPSKISKTKGESTEETQADILIRLGGEAQYFQNDLEEAYAAIKIQAHTEVITVKSHKFKKWLTKLYYEETKRAPGNDAMNQAIGVMEMKALYDGAEHNLHIRVAEKDGSFYYDLSNKEWSIVKIAPNSCEVLLDPPILFTRNRNIKAQAMPDFDGDLKLILNHVRIKDVDDQIMYLVYLVTCLIPNIPHLVLVFSGEKGASKSTSMRMTRQVVDPVVQELLSMPSSMQDLALSLANNYMPSYDNLDGLTAAQSDLLCISSTGGGFSKRMLYSDAEETLLEIQRCAMMTGINVAVTRADLIDRSGIIELERIPERERKDERTIWDAFETDRASIIGGALSTLSKAMALHANVKLERLPRMADFTRWGYAIAEVLGYGGEQFLQAYQHNRNKSNEEAISSHPVAASIVALMQNNSKWSGPVATLLSVLEEVAEREKISTNVAKFPKSANMLSRRLQEVKSNLEDVGITFEIRHAGNYKEITIYKKDSNLIKLPINEDIHLISSSSLPKKRKKPRRIPFTNHPHIEFESDKPMDEASWFAQNHE